jgi:hypothetical protein
VGEVLAWRRLSVTLLLAVIGGGRAAPARAQVEGPAATYEEPGPSWNLGATALLYLVPDGEDYLVPIVTADRGGLHLEVRYNYEDFETASLFAGWTWEFGESPWLAVTPMLGGVVGRTTGMAPGLELDTGAGPVELSAEAEYLFDVEESANDFLYLWSELSIWPLYWLRAGIAGQRTRLVDTSLELERGPLVGAAAGAFELAAYLFNPGGDDQYFVLSLGVTF